MRTNSISNRAFTCKTLDFVDDSFIVCLYVFICSIYIRIVGEFLLCMECKTEPMGVSFKFCLVCISHIGKSELIVTVEKVCAIKEVELYSHSVVVMSLFEHLHKFIVKK